MANDIGGAGVRRQQGCEHAQQCGLACAVRAKNAENHPARNFEIDTIHGAHIAEMFGQAARLDRS